MKTAFIGLGIMGSRMAMNICCRENDLTVYNRTKSKADPLLSQGAAWGDSPAAAVADADLVFTMLSTPAVVRKVALEQEDAFLPVMKEGALWLDCSTVNPSFSRQMAQEARQRGIRFADAPVAGTKGPAEHGELTFLVGAEEQELQSVRPFFDAMGNKTLYLGDTGMGTSMKMVVNLLLGQAMLAFAEASQLGEQLGISSEFLLQILPKLPVTAPFLEAKSKKLKQNDTEAEFPLEWMQKDLHLVSEAAYEAGLSLPAASLADALYARAKQEGRGREDFSAIYNWYRGG